MSKDTIPVVLPVPREVKAAWVRQSQAEGKKLTDWLLERIKAGHEAITGMPTTTIRYTPQVAQELHEAHLAGAKFGDTRVLGWCHHEKDGSTTLYAQFHSGAIMATKQVLDDYFYGPGQRWGIAKEVPPDAAFIGVKDFSY